MKNKQKERRTFSIAFKKEKVALIESGKITVKEVSIIYDVSRTAIYRWIKKYSKLPETERVVVEKISEGAKNIELLHRIGELERTVGQKQMELDFYKSAIEIISEQEGTDVLKKFKPKQ